MKKQIITNSSRETKELAKKFSKKIKGGEVLALKGDLGSGKTTFVQGLAKGLDVKENITSPTFVILNLHKSKKGLQLAHFDLYRLNNERDLEGIGATDYLGKDKIISVIEWPERAKKLLPKNTIWITFEHIDENRRKITFKK
ncbi:tRNA (adenosine(37)-N6)-threonylcarbamoyltransferase complex ATPase subunit type 1 TsaE [Patescibacteria group bacterium]|nr:tRNA (adenosine(37)-N6)-threonylcarbamoyltransferase complex ATPase subunit type 1 TsaE [Patescibacteria group bacterium]